MADPELTDDAFNDRERLSRQLSSATVKFGSLAGDT
jgi:hypothetical protein